MAFAKQSMIWKDFYGGISQDDYLTTGKQVLYAENVDLTSSSDYVQLGKNSEGRYVTTDEVNGFILVQKDNSTLRPVFAYTADGKIYDTSDGTVESSTIGDDIKTAIRFSDYIYFISNDSTYPIRRIPEDDAHGKTWGTLTNITALAFDASGEKVYPTLSYLDAYFFLGVGNTVYKIDVDNTMETFDIFDGKVVGLSNIGGVIKVFTDKGKVCFWDGASLAVDSVLDLHTTVRGIINQGKIDYIITGHSDFQSRIKVLNGYTVQQLSNARNSDVFGNYIGKIDYTDTHQISRLGETIYFAQDGATTKDVLRYGTNNPVLSAGFNISNGKDSNGNNIDNIRSLCGVEFGFNDGLFIGMNSNSQEAFEYVDITSGNYVEEGYLITNPFDGGSKSQKKKIEELIIVTSNCDASETVELQVSIDGGAFSTIQTVNSGTTLTRTEIFDHVDDFIDIKFKVILSSNGSTSTAKLHEIGLTYTVIE